MVSTDKTDTKPEQKRLVLTRVFDAPRELVFKVWIQPEHLSQWWGPRLFSVPHCEVDPTPGGAFAVDMQAPDGTLFPGGGVFKEVVEPERLVFTSTAFEDENGIPMLEVLNTVTFEEFGSMTKVTLVADVVRSTPETAGALEGMEQGWSESLYKLADYLYELTSVLDMKLEVVPLPVSDIDTARDFYVEKVGFNLDHDTVPTEGVRVVQLTPPGSACSVVMGTGLGDMSEMKPGSQKGLHLVVTDAAAIRDVLATRGVEVSEIVEYPRGIKFAYFSDPDGNSWALQEIPPGV